MPRVLPEVVVGATATVVLSWDAGRPAPWLDELATLSAVRRSWHGLAMLFGGPDAPLVPYYVLMKLWFLVGGETSVSPWVWLRLPSVIFGVATTVVLTRFLRRQLGTSTALTAGFLLVAFAGLSRESQEARPNALAPLLACLLWLLWWEMLHRPTRNRAIAYGALVAVGSVLQIFLVAQVIAQLIAAVLLTSRAGRMRTVTTGCAGLALVAPWVAWVAWHGTGPIAPPKLTVAHIAEVIVGALSARGTNAVAGGIVGALAVVGAVALLTHRALREHAVMLISWAVAGPAALVVYATVKPAVLQARYCLTSLPAWAALAGIGSVAVATSLASLLPRRLHAAPIGYVVGALIGVVVLAIGVVQVPTQLAMRASTGHHEDIRPVMALVQSARWSGDVLVPATNLTALELIAYAPALRSRIVGFDFAPHSRIWPQRSRIGRRHVAEMLLIDRPLFHTQRIADLQKARTLSTAGIPGSLERAGYRTGRVLLHRGGWVVTQLVRDTGS